MARKLGTGRSSDESGSKKWTSGVKSQVESTPKVNINTKYVTLSQICLDPKNPRQLKISPEKISEIARTVPLKKEWLDNASDKDWWEEFSNNLSHHLSGKSLQDYLDLSLLAVSIKSHDRLLNPVTTYASSCGSQLNLIAGERRFLAHIILGETIIAARVLPSCPSGLEKDILQWEENNQRQDLSLFERVINLKRLVNGWESDNTSKLSVNQFVSLVGIPRATAHRYLTVIRCQNESLINAMEQGVLTSLKKAASLSSLSESEIDEILNPSSKKTQKPKSAIKITRSKDYGPTKTILQSATSVLGTEKLIEEINSLNLDTADGITLGFEMLSQHLEEQVN
ncbi:MAG: ParB/RepB/Spo0J family partition protein [Gammaproteobacteria bacterium]